MQINQLTVGNEQNNPAFKVEVKKAPLFENKAWLWALMAVIIVLLSFFAFRMLKS
mgnify:CR=1 FL=1